MAKETNELIHGEEEVQADIWRCISGFTEMAVSKCAIELGISDFLETHQEPVPLCQLSSALGCSASSLHRILRFLINRGIFKLLSTGNGEMGYVQTPVSRLLKRDGENSMAALILLESSPVMLAPWHYLSARVLSKENTGAFGAAHGKDLWEYAKTNPEHSKLINDAMACHAQVTMHAIIDNCAEIFKGIESLVDVGGGNGTTLGMLVKAFPWINGINFDLPHVMSVAPPCHGVVHVEGDMFHCVPKAQAAFLMWVLHDWSDEECIQILKKCIEAIPKDTGKVIIVEAVLDEKIGKEKGLKDVGLMLDMMMLAHTTNGKERTAKEWAHILSAAGFIRNVPVVWKLHALSATLLSGMSIFEEDNSRNLYKALQDVYGQLLDREEKVNAKSLKFKTDIHENYSTFIDNLVEQFAAVSYGDMIFGRQVGVYLHQFVEAPVRLAAWNALSNACALELLPPLEKCIAATYGYLEPIEDDERILEAYCKSWVSGALDKAARRGSASFTLALHHLSSFIFQTCSGNMIPLRNKLVKSLQRDYSRKKQHEVLFINLLEYQRPDTRSEPFHKECMPLQSCDVVNRLQILNEACEGNSSLLNEVEKLNSVITRKQHVDS